jgi:putative membrane protein
MTDRRVVTTLSVTLLLVIAFLVLGPRPPGVAGSLDVSALPWVNATINSVTTVVLLCAFAAIRAKRVRLHRALMLTAFALSALFLVVYVTYHWFSAGPTRYEGDYRTLYLLVLLTHVGLATVILPLALTTLSRGLRGEISRHRPLARITLPIWLYVSSTGVLIVWMAHGS